MDWNDLAIHIVREITPAFLKPHRFVLDIPKLKAVLSGTIQIKDPREVWITADQIIQTSLLQLVRQMADRAIIEVRKVHIEETPHEHRKPDEHIDIVKHRVGEILRKMHEEWNIQAWDNNQYPAMALQKHPRDLLSWLNYLALCLVELVITPIVKYGDRRDKTSRTLHKAQRLRTNA
jgi:hypothetical protein